MNQKETRSFNEIQSVINDINSVTLNGKNIKLAPKVEETEECG